MRADRFITMKTVAVFDCPTCGRHYEETELEQLQDLVDAFEVAGFCCEYCWEDHHGRHNTAL